MSSKGAWVPFFIAAYLSCDTLNVMVLATKSASPETMLITPSDTISSEYI